MQAQKSKLRVFTALLIICLLAFLFYEYGFLGIQSELESLQESRAAKTRTLEKYMALIGQKPQLEKELAALREVRQQEEGKIIQGKSSSLAAAQLEQIIKGVIGGRGGQITTERTEPLEDYGGFKIVTVSIDVVFPDARVMTDSLLSLETQTPYLVIRELDARVRNFKEPREIMAKLKISTLAAGKQQ
jgi:hypothetical protein